MYVPEGIILGSGVLNSIISRRNQRVSAISEISYDFRRKYIIKDIWSRNVENETKKDITFNGLPH